MEAIGGAFDDCGVGLGQLDQIGVSFATEVSRRLLGRPRFGQWLADSALFFNEFRYRDHYGSIVGSGSGSCLYKQNQTHSSWSNLSQQTKQGYFSWTPCQGYPHFFFPDNPRPHLEPMCPAAVPLAVLGISKAGSTSMIQWVSMMDTVAVQVARLIAFVAECICRPGPERQLSYAEMYTPILMTLLDPFLHELDVSSAYGNMRVSRHLAMMAGSGCDFPGRPLSVWLPPMYCAPCCIASDSAPRMRLAMVRNPYRRFVASYLTQFRGDAELFPQFVEDMHFLWRRNSNILVNPNTLMNDELPLRFDLLIRNGSSGTPELHRRVLFHFRPAYYELLEAFVQQSRKSANPLVHVMHLETVHIEWPAALEILCREFMFCDPLPKLSALNAGRSSVWQPNWATSTRHRIMEMFSEDFRIFGYGHDPLEPSPLEVKIVRVHLPFESGSDSNPTIK